MSRMKTDHIAAQTLFGARFRWAAGLFLVSTSSASAHEGAPHDVAELTRSWTFEPGIVIPLVIAAWLYFRGVYRLRAVSPQALGAMEVWCYAAGWITLVIALVSPLHPWGNVLFSAHMTQHELLMLVAAPLLVLGKPVVACLKAIPPKWVRRLLRCSKPPWVQAAWRAVTTPFVAWLVHA